MSNYCILKFGDITGSDQKVFDLYDLDDVFEQP
jgi:hypothetical protein